MQNKITSEKNKIKILVGTPIREKQHFGCLTSVIERESADPA